MWGLHKEGALAVGSNQGEGSRGWAWAMVCLWSKQPQCCYATVPAVSKTNSTAFGLAHAVKLMHRTSQASQALTDGVAPCGVPPESSSSSSSNTRVS